MKLLSVSGKFVKAHEFGVEKEEEPELELTSDEAAVVEKVIVMIMLVGIMKSSVENEIIMMIILPHIVIIVIPHIMVLMIQVRGIWSGILKSSVENETDFFAAGAGSMDVVRLIEEVKTMIDGYIFIVMMNTTMNHGSMESWT